MTDRPNRTAQELADFEALQERRLVARAGTEDEAEAIRELFAERARIRAQSRR